MDVVGLVASVITLAQLVGEGITLAKTLYHAPDELTALQVRHFKIRLLKHRLYSFRMC